jgi:hypothetical protein
MARHHGLQADFNPTLSKARGAAHKRGAARGEGGWRRRAAALGPCQRREWGVLPLHLRERVGERVAGANFIIAPPPSPPPCEGEGAGGGPLPCGARDLAGDAGGDAGGQRRPA